MKFRFSGNLLRYVDYRREIDVDGTTLAEGFDNVAKEFPQFRRVILDSNGEVRMIHRFFINREQLEPGNFDCQIGPTDEVIVLTPIAGG